MLFIREDGKQLFINEKEYPIMTDEELREFVGSFEHATKEELAKYIIVYHKQLRKVMEV
jgi:hypothetical protein